MAFGANRLNLPNIVDKQLKYNIAADAMARAPVLMPAQTYFEPLVLTNDEQSKVQSQPKKRENYIDASLNSILNTLHQNMKTYSSPEPAVPAIPPAITQIPSKQSDPPERNKCRNPSDKNKPNKPRRTPLKSTSIPQIKADCALKCQQRMRRNIGRPNDMNNYTNQQRVKELLHQKSILQDMLFTHQKLKHDRQVIATEIASMRSQLNDIRNKLDYSVKKLKSKRTVTEFLPKPKKTPQIPQVRRPMSNTVKNKPGKRAVSLNPHRLNTKKNK